MLVVASETQSGPAPPWTAAHGFLGVALSVGALLMFAALQNAPLAWHVWPVVALLTLSTLVGGIGALQLFWRAWIGGGTAGGAGSGAPALELRGPWLVYPLWPGADARISFPWTDIKRVSARSATKRSRRWRRSHGITEANAASVISVEVTFEDGRKPLFEGSLALHLHWLLSFPTRAYGAMTGSRQVQLVVHSSPQLARAICEVLEGLSARPDIRNRISDPKHVWHVEVGDDGTPDLVMAGGRHRERLGNLLERPWNPGASWG